jgi:hypothetical protein
MKPSVQFVVNIVRDSEEPSPVKCPGKEAIWRVLASPSNLTSNCALVGTCLHEGRLQTKLLSCLGLFFFKLQVQNYPKELISWI